MFRILSLVIGYFIGCINFAFIIGHFREHIDIRDYGSGNSGTTNAIRVMGWKLGLVTFLGDFFKSFLAYILIKFVMGENDIAGLYAGFGAVVGHNWPVFLKFKGGKGIASTLGLIYAVDFRVGIVVNLLMALIIYVTKYVSLGSIFMAIVMPITFYFVKEGQPDFIFVGVFLMLTALYRHRGNIKRLIHGNENKLGSKK